MELGLNEIKTGLAAMMYYQSLPPKEKGKKAGKRVQFEELTEEQRKTYISLAESVLIQLDQLNLKVIPKAKARNEAEIEELLKARIEGAVKDFFSQVKVWKKDLIPQQELVAKIYQVWATL